MTTTRDWEKEFDEDWEKCSRKEFKDFVRSLITAERQEAAREERKRIQQVIMGNWTLSKMERQEVPGFFVSSEKLQEVFDLTHDGKEDK